MIFFMSRTQNQWKSNAFAIEGAQFSHDFESISGENHENHKIYQKDSDGEIFLIFWGYCRTVFCRT